MNRSHDLRGLLLMHGMMFDHLMWQPVLDNLARDHRIPAVDLPDHGASPTRPHYAQTEASETPGHFPTLADVTRFTASIRSRTEGSSS